MEIEVENENDADVDNNVGAISNTGLNLIVGCGCEEDNDEPCKRDRCGRRGHHHHHNNDDEGNAYIGTGAAVSTAEAFTALNTNMTVIN